MRTNPAMITFAAGSAISADLAAIAQWLNNTLTGSPSGLGWTCIEAWDGTTRSAPSGGSMANLPGGHGWKPGGTVGVTAGRWCVLQAPGEDSVNPFQIRLYTTAGSQASIDVYPLADWTVGGGTGASPTIPAKVLAMDASNMPGLDGGSAPMFWSLAADNGTLTGARWKNPPETVNDDTLAIYVGEVLPTYPSAVDARPVVLKTQPLVAGLDSTTVWARLSPVDGTTVLTSGRSSVYEATVVAGENLSKVSLLDVPIRFYQTASHGHTAGMLKYTAEVIRTWPTAAAVTATLGPDGSTREYLAIAEGAGGERWCVRYNGGAAGTHYQYASRPLSTGGGYPLVRSYPYLVRSSR